ncbi:hypothetical protein [Nostoc sp.]|uniref:hypothetical protein n=1 Tax=Nostoc sp. TaxID=1180 RepID=UPI002FF71363
MGWASRPPVVKGGQDVHPTRLDNLFVVSPLSISFFSLRPLRQLLETLRVGGSLKNKTFSLN